MKCDKAKSELLDYYYDELNDEERKRFKQHIKSCNDCEAAIKELELTSASLKKWEIPDPKLNMVFVVERASWTEKVKELFKPFAALKLHPLKSVGYGFASVLLLFSFVNFEANYNSDTGSIGVSTSMFGNNDRSADYNYLLEQLILSQNQVELLLQERLAEQELRQREEFNGLLTVIMQDLENKRQQDLENVGFTLQSMYDFTDKRFEDTQNIVYNDILAAIRTDTEIKK